MARKKAPEVIQNNDADTEALNQGVGALVETSGNAAQVAEMMGYDLPYDRERIIQEARFYMGQSAEAMLEAGKRLIMLKENETEHGQFTRIVEERLGLTNATSHRMMQAAAKFLINPKLQLGSNLPTLVSLGKSKLFELMVMDDGDIKNFAEGGTIAGLEFDEIDRMSVRELKAALRETKETAEATDKVLAAKNKKIDQLTTELERKKNNTPADEWEWAPARRDVLDAAESIANFAHSELRRAFVAIDEQAETSGSGVPEDIILLREQALTAAMQSLVTLQKEFHINADLESMVTPPWMKDFQAGKGKNTD